MIRRQSHRPKTRSQDPQQEEAPMPVAKRLRHVRTSSMQPMPLKVTRVADITPVTLEATMAKEAEHLRGMLADRASYSASVLCDVDGPSHHFLKRLILTLVPDITLVSLKFASLNQVWN